MTQLELKCPKIFREDPLFDHILSNFFYDPVEYKRPTNGHVTETDSHIKLELELPGYEKSEVSIDYKDTVLTIEATKKSDDTRNSRQQYTIKGIDLKKSSAELKNGILTLQLEKHRSAKKQQLKIT